MKSIIDMIRQIGTPVKLETVISWNPMITKHDIERCQDLEIINDMVGIKKESINIDELSYEELVELISKYNEKLQEYYDNIDEKRLKTAAMKKWLENRYEEVKLLDTTELYETFEVKRKGSIQLYAICDEYTEEVGNALLKLFNDEDVTICCIKRVYDGQLGFQKFMNTDEIIKENMDKYKLQSKPVEILKIEKETN